MPRVLIAGCGYVGQAAARLFLERGWEVEGWTRSGAPNETKFRMRAVDIAEMEQVQSAGGGFDLVIQATSTRGGNPDLYRRVYLEGARNLCRVFAGAKMIFTSSTSVYGQSNGEWVDEKSETKPSRETGRVLLEAERAVLDRGGIVIRFGGVYGPGRSALLEKFLRSNGQIEPAADRYLNAVHRDDAAQAYFVLTEEPAGLSEPGIYNAVDNEPVLMAEAFRWLRETIHRDDLPDAPASISQRRGASNKRVSNAKLRALGWAPRYPSIREGMRDSVLPARDLAGR